MNKTKVKTLDGERTRLQEMNLGNVEVDPADRSLMARLKRAYRNASLLMAGMYTGLNCYGTPRTHHEYGEDGEEKPDNRPI
ncbi:MAG: hypothetical protein O2861_12725 [Proteobacteria bacterium]|nr:hypothetical protein [Pseudomonadota bacterium]